MRRSRRRIFPWTDTPFLPSEVSAQPRGEEESAVFGAPGYAITVEAPVYCGTRALRLATLDEHDNPGRGGEE